MTILFALAATVTAPAAAEQVSRTQLAAGDEARAPGAGCGANCALGRVRGRRRPGARVTSQFPRAGSVRPAGTKVRVRVR